jgi:hypothetical protein
MNATSSFLRRQLLPRRLWDFGGHTNLWSLISLKGDDC